MNQYNLLGESFNPKDFSSLLIPVVKDEDNELVRADMKAYNEYSNDIQLYDYINSYIKESYIKPVDESAEEEKKKQAAKEWQSSLGRDPSSVDQLADEATVRSRELNNIGPMVFRNNVTGKLLFGQPARDELQWTVSQGRDNVEGIFGFENTALGQVALRMMGSEFNTDSFYEELNKLNMSLDPEKRKQTLERLKGMAGWAEYGALANWVQFLPGVDPEDRFNASEEVLNVFGYKGFNAFGRNYYSSDPFDLAANLPANPNWNYNKAWEAFTTTNPGAAAWFETNGFNVQSRLKNTRHELDFFYELNEFIDTNAFQRIMSSDVEQMSSTGYAWKTTVLPLIRDSFASVDAPLDIAVTVGLGTLTAGTSTAALVGARTALMAGKIGSTSLKTLNAVQRFRKGAEVVTSWLPHNIAGRFAKNATSITGKTASYVGTSVGNGIITGAWYNINNQLNNMDNDDTYRWSTENLAHDIALEIVGELGLGGAATMAQAGVFKLGGLIDKGTGSYIGKAAKKQFEKLPTELKEVLKASASLARVGNMGDMNNYELQLYTDSVVMMYAMRTAGVIDQKNPTLNFRTAAAWGVATSRLSAEKANTTLKTAKEEFARKKKELQDSGSTEVLTDEDQDMYVSNMLLSAMLSDSRVNPDTQERIFNLWNSIEREQFNREFRSTPEIETKQKEISDLEDQKLDLVEQLAKRSKKISQVEKDILQVEIDDRTAKIAIKTSELETLQSSVKTVENMSAEELATKLYEWRKGKRERVKTLLGLINPSATVAATTELLSPEEMQQVATDLGASAPEVIQAMAESEVESGLPRDLGVATAGALSVAAASVSQPAAPAMEAAPVAEVVPEVEAAPVTEAAPITEEAAEIVTAEPAVAPSTEVIEATPEAVLTEIIGRLKSIDRVYLFNNILQKYKDACK